MSEKSTYSIQKLDQDRYLVFGKNYARIDDLFIVVSEDLKKKKFKGELVFDLLLSNGNNSSRFFQITFTGEVFELDTLKKIKQPDNGIIDKVNSYLRKHRDILYNGILSTNEINRLISSL